MLFSTCTPENSAAHRKRWASDAVVFALTLAATAVMMLCPCDVVGLHDHGAIALVGAATVMGFAAAAVLYRRLGRTSGITGFLRVLMAVAIVGLGIFVELLVAQEAVALLARR